MLQISAQIIKTVTRGNIIHFRHLCQNVPVCHFSDSISFSFSSRYSKSWYRLTIRDLTCFLHQIHYPLLPMQNWDIKQDMCPESAGTRNLSRYQVLQTNLPCLHIYWKKAVEHTHIKGFAKTSWTCDQRNIIPVVPSLPYKICLINVKALTFS